MSLAFLSQAGGGGGSAGHSQGLIRGSGSGREAHTTVHHLIVSDEDDTPKRGGKDKDRERTG